MGRDTYCRRIPCSHRLVRRICVTVAVVAFIAVGSLALVYLVNFNHPYLFSNGFLVSVILLILVNISGRAYDARRRQNG